METISRCRPTFSVFSFCNYNDLSPSCCKMVLNTNCRKDANGMKKMRKLKREHGRFSLQAVLHLFNTSFFFYLAWRIPFDNPVIVRIPRGFLFSWGWMDGWMEDAGCCWCCWCFPKNIQTLGPGWYKMMNSRPLLCIHTLFPRKHHHQQAAHKARRRTRSSTLPSASSTCLRRRCPPG